MSMLQCYILLPLFFIDSYDSNNTAAIIGAIVGVICTVIIIMVITNIMVCIYCFRKRHHTGMYAYVHMYLLVNGVILYHLCTQEDLQSYTNQPKIQLIQSTTILLVTVKYQ